jgi:hypothetical protein
MTLEQSGALMMDVTFRGRIKASAVKFGLSVLDEDPTIDAHNTRFAWARATLQNPEAASSTLQSPVVMDAAVQAAGVDSGGKALIDDPGLQTAVETTIAKML